MSATQVSATQAALPLFDNAQAWTGPEMAARTDWIHALDADEVAELRAAVATAMATGRPVQALTRADFPLDRLAARLDAIRHEVLHGRGFFLMRGVPVGEWSLAESAAAFWGMGLVLGEPVSQNGKGHVLGHVANLGLDYGDPEVRGYQTSAHLNYHTDSSDVVGLLSLRTPKSGGLSSIVSSTTLWNRLAAERPDLARALLEPFPYTRWGEVPEGRDPWFGMPVFTPWQGRMIGAYVGSAVRKAQRLPGVPPLSAAQQEAMAALDALAGDPALRLDMDFRPGDVQWLCNHGILHSRTAYEDWPEPARRRHLLRLWLACPDGPALPPAFTDTYQGRTETGRPDGIRVPGVPLHAPLEPA